MTSFSESVQVPSLKNTFDRRDDKIQKHNDDQQRKRGQDAWINHGGINSPL